MLIGVDAGRASTSYGNTRQASSHPAILPAAEMWSSQTSPASKYIDGVNICS